jgi:Ca2+-transporting ATPase
MENFKQLWSLSVDKSLEMINSSHEGLADKEAEERLLRYGKNAFSNKEKKGPFPIFLKQFVN